LGREPFEQGEGGHAARELEGARKAKRLQRADQRKIAIISVGNRGPVA
jgi:hypothetical protein